MKHIDIKKLIITSIVGVVLVVGCLFIYKIHVAVTTAEVLTSICNSFFVVGGIFLFLGLLLWCTNHGAFTGLTYGIKRVFDGKRLVRNLKERETYGDYRARKLAKQKDYLHFILIGVIFLIISIILIFFI